MHTMILRNAVVHCINVFVFHKFPFIEAAVRRYCNAEVTVEGGEGGYIKSPGYPLYYPGEYPCGWTFETIPGQRVALVFHDFSIRGK